MNTLSLFDKIPSLLIYFLPGFLFIEVKNFLIPSKKRSDLELVLGSIFWSFFIITISKLFVKTLSLFIVFNHDVVNSNPTNPFYVTGLLLFALISGILWGKLITSNWYNSQLQIFKIRHKISANVWNEVLNLPNGGWVKAYLKDRKCMYIGQLIHYSIDPNSEEKELFLINYSIYHNYGKLIYKGEANSGVYLQKEHIYALEVFPE